MRRTATFSTTRAERLLAFYRDLIGCHVVFDVAWTAADGPRAERRPDVAVTRYVLLGLQSSYVELVELAPRVAHTAGALRLEVEDLDALRARFAEAGTVLPSHHGTDEPLRLADPDGNPLELVQLSRPAARRCG